MGLSRAAVAGFFLATLTFAMALLVAGSLVWWRTGVVSVPLLTVGGATVALLLVLASVLATRSPTQRVQLPHCHRCGTRLFATLRSMDRREVLTCFACGAEWAVPARSPPWNAH